jgi:hypothetical protein
MYNQHRCHTMTSSSTDECIINTFTALTKMIATMESRLDDLQKMIEFKSIREKGRLPFTISGVPIFIVDPPPPLKPIHIEQYDDDSSSEPLFIAVHISEYLDDEELIHIKHLSEKHNLTLHGTTSRALVFSLYKYHESYSDLSQTLANICDIVATSGKIIEFVNVSYVCHLVALVIEGKADCCQMDVRIYNYYVDQFFRSQFIDFYFHTFAEIYLCDDCSQKFLEMDDDDD